MVAPARGGVGGWAGMGGVGAATVATSLDYCVERKCVWEAGGEELLTPLIKNNIINLIFLEHDGGGSRVREAAPREN
jgi:hypothetical protein